jgi:hypothetical protein
VNEYEQSFLFTHMLRTCRKKATRKNYAGDKLTPDEKNQFQNCIYKYVLSSQVAYEGLREGFIESI